MSGVTLKMSGEYRCVAVNSAGEAVCAANVAVVGELQSLYIQCISLDVSLSTQQEKPCVLPT